MVHGDAQLIGAARRVLRGVSSHLMGEQTTPPHHLTFAREATIAGPSNRPGLERQTRLRAFSIPANCWVAPAMGTSARLRLPGRADRATIALAVQQARLVLAHTSDWCGVSRGTLHRFCLVLLVQVVPKSGRLGIKNCTRSAALAGLWQASAVIPDE